MTGVSITELRRQLPACMARAARGERLRVTRRGTVMAALGPPTRQAKQADRARSRLAGSVLRLCDPYEPVLEPSRWGGGR